MEICDKHSVVLGAPTDQCAAVETRPWGTCAPMNKRSSESTSSLYDQEFKGQLNSKCRIGVGSRKMENIWKCSLSSLSMTDIGQIQSQWPRPGYEISYTKANRNGIRESKNVPLHKVGDTPLQYLSALWETGL